jgi:hypothetical protein
MADFWWRAVVVKKARVRVEGAVVVARRRVTAAVLDVSADIVIAVTVLVFSAVGLPVRLVSGRCD